MIIYTNPANPLALALSICARAGGSANTLIEKSTLADAKLNGSPAHLPSLILDSGKTLFCANAAAKYLFPVRRVEDTTTLDEWLEWSKTRLLPAFLQSNPISGRPDPKARTVLHEELAKLNERLGSAGPFLTGEHFSAADAIVWSLIGLEGVIKGAPQVNHIDAWYKRVADIAEVKDAVKDNPVAEQKITALHQSNNYGGFQHIELGVQNQAKSKKTESSSPVAAVVEDAPTPDEKQTVVDHFVYVDHVVEKEPRTVLPIPGRKNVLITSSLPYVNNVPHLGNIIGCVLSADIFARYSRMAGYNTLYICGTDEYGTATEAKALAENLTPQQICDKYFEMHNSIYRWFGIGFDYFGRTSTPEQKQITQEMFLDLHKAGYMDTESVDQLLCAPCKRYLADRFVEGVCPHPGCGYEDARGDQCDSCGKLVNAIELIKPRCSVCRATPEVVKSNQFFINLPKIEPQLREWFAKVEHGWSNNARVITKAWLKEGLRPRCITRDLKWGIPVPFEGYESKVFYVWFDAPIGYVSITARYTKEWRKWWAPKEENVKVDLYQFMAKDNVPFHSVMFPSTLLGLNQGHTMVSHLMATEYLNYEDGKFSKSRGIGVFGNDAQETGIPSDVWRFYLASARPEGQDSNFSWSDLVTRNNSELLNNLGNFVNRALVFAEKNFDGIVPAVRLTEDELQLLSYVNREIRSYVQSMETSKFRDGIKHLLTVSRLGNQYLQAQQPWVLLKGMTEQQERAATVIGLCCNLCCLLGNLLFPFMPETARQIYAQLNTVQRKINPEKPYIQRYFEPGHTLGKPSPLFARIETTRLEELKAKYGGTQQGSAKAADVPVLQSVAEATKAVADQGEKVRQMKASGVEKAVVQQEVAILLKLKKQLASLSTAAPAAPTATSATVSVAEATKAVADQAEKVRLLKASGVEKSAWQPEVDILLKLKKQLSSLSTAAPAAPAAATATISLAEATKAVADQGEKVRLLKASGVEKAAWQPEVDILLKLKKQLASITSAAPAASTPTPAASVEVATKAVAVQAEKVRTLKTGGAEKSVWQPEVDILLNLKKQLAALEPSANGAPAAASTAAASSKKSSKKK